MLKDQSLIAINRDLKGVELPEDSGSVEKRLVGFDHFRLFYQSLLEGKLADGFDYKSFEKVFNDLYPKPRLADDDSVIDFLAHVKSGGVASLDKYEALFAKLEEGVNVQDSPVIEEGCEPGVVYNFPDKASDQFNRAMRVLHLSIDQVLYKDTLLLTKDLTKERFALLAHSASLREQRDVASTGYKDASHDAYHARIAEGQATSDLIAQASDAAKRIDPEKFLHEIASLLRLPADNERIVKIKEAAFVGGFPDIEHLSQAVVDLVTEVKLEFDEHLAAKAEALSGEFSAMSGKFIESSAREEALREHIAKTKERDEEEVKLREEIAELNRQKLEIETKGQIDEAGQRYQSLMLNFELALKQNEILKGEQSLFLEGIEALQVKLKASEKAKAAAEGRSRSLVSQLEEFHGETGGLRRQLGVEKRSLAAKEKELEDANLRLVDLQRELEDAQENFDAERRGFVAQRKRAEGDRRSSIGRLEDLKREYAGKVANLEEGFALEKGGLAREVATREEIIVSLQRGNAELKQDNSALISDLKQLRTRFAQAERDRDGALSSAADANEKLAALESRLEKLADISKEKVSEHHQALSDLRTELATAQSEKEAAEARALKSKTDYNKLAEKLATLSLLKDAADKGLAAAESKAQRLEAANAELTTSLAAVQGKLSKLKAAQEKLRTEKGQAVQRAAELEAEINGLRRTAEASGTEKDQAHQRQMKVLQAELAAAQRDAATKAAKLTDLEGRLRGLTTAKTELESRVSTAEASAHEAVQRATKAEEDARQSIAVAERKAAENIAALEAKFKSTNQKLKEQHKAKLVKLEADHNTQLATLTSSDEESKQAVTKLNEDHQAALQRMRQGHAAELRKAKEAREADLARIKADLAAAQRDAATKAAKLTDLGARFERLTAANTELESRVSTAEASVRDSEQRAARAEERAARFEGEAERLGEENSSLREKFTEFTAEIARFKEKFATIEYAEARSTEIQKEIDSLRLEYASKLKNEQAEKAQLQADLIEAEQNLQTVASERDKAIVASETAAQENTSLQQENERLHARFEELNKDLAMLATEKTALKKEISAEKKKFAKANKNAQRLEAELKKVQERLKAGLASEEEVAAKNLELHRLGNDMQSARETLLELNALKEEQDDKLRSLTEELEARNDENAKLQEALLTSQVDVRATEKRATVSDAKLLKAQAEANLVRREVNEKDAVIEDLTAQNTDLRRQLESLQAEIDSSRKMYRPAPEMTDAAIDATDLNEGLRVNSRPSFRVSPASAAQTSISMEKVFNDTRNFLFTNRIASNDRFSVVLNAEKPSSKITFDFDRQTAEALAESINKTKNRNERRNDLAIIKAYHLMKGGLPDGYHYDMSISNTRPKGTLKGEKDNNKIHRLAQQCLENLTAEEKRSIKDFATKVITQSNSRSSSVGR